MASDIILNDNDNSIELIGNYVRLKQDKNQNSPIEFKLVGGKAYLRFGTTDSSFNAIKIVDKRGETRLAGGMGINTNKVVCETARVNNLEIGALVKEGTAAETGKIQVYGKNGKSAITLNGESESIEFAGVHPESWSEPMIYMSDISSPNPANKRSERSERSKRSDFNRDLSVDLSSIDLTKKLDSKYLGVIDFEFELNLKRPIFSHSKKYKDWGLLYNYSNSAMIFQSNGKPVLTADLANKKVGIGTSAPSHTLHVEGEVAGRGNFKSLSDARCKQNINAISNGLDKIMSLQGVSFNWDENDLTGKSPPKEKQLGFIAQDVEKVIPEAVSKDLKGRMSLAYSSIIPLLVEAVKSQQNEIHLQNKKIKSQYDENVGLQERVNNMESKLSTLISEIREIKNA